MTQAFEDERTVAEATARIALGDRVSKMQDSRRSIKALIAPDCMVPLATWTGLAVDADVDSLLSFMKQEDGAAAFSKSIAADLWEKARAEERRINLNLPADYTDPDRRPSRVPTPETISAPTPIASSSISAPLVAQESLSDEPVRVGEGISPPQLLRKSNPIYPESARAAGKEGVVILEVIITADGNVRSAKILKPVDSSLDAAALDAVRGWQYRPATKAGKAVPVYLTVTVTFNLDRRRQ